ncbi:MAG: hypothetical protein JO304_15525 [Solirubrobacterales bacterium]|nr:hypothetical protein [Solirubrobacterales bacterium]
MDVDDLYGLPLEEFVPARNALARELRNSGRREDAAEVAALRKPSVAGWAVNQLVRTQKRGVAELFEAGDALRAAHDNVLSGRGDATELRAGVEQERTAVDDLTGAARGLLTSQGHELSPTIIERVADTLHAAALDDGARAQVRDGRLERELRHVGLGMAASGAAATAPAPPSRAAKTRAGGTKAEGTKAEGTKAGRRAAETRAEREERERAERERAEARAAARATEREARRRLERAERAAGAAADRRDRAASALDEAEAELAEAESELEEARDQLGTAEAALRELGR